MRAYEGFSFSSVSANQALTIQFGGVFVLDVVATWGGGSVTLNRLGPDGVTYVAAAAALTANGTTGSLALPQGTYQLTIATATGVYANLLRVPGE